jgi:hypothetical protein
MHIKLILPLLIIFPLSVSAEITDSERIEKIKKMNANTIHSSLPKMPYGKWFSNLVGNKKKINWHVTDCGEQNGSGNQKDFPICVEVSAKYLKNKTLFISTVFGTYKKGLVGTPKVWMVFIKENGKYNVFENINETMKNLANEKISNK